MPHPAIAADLESIRERVVRLLDQLWDLDMVVAFPPALSADQQLELEERTSLEVDELRAALKAALRTLGIRLLVYTDALGLPVARRLVADWRRRWVDDALGSSQLVSSTDNWGRESVPFNDILPIVDGFLVLVKPADAPPPDPVQRRDHERLEYCLRALAKVCHDRGVVPLREHDVQRVMHSHLEAVFPDYSRRVTISKPIVSFLPDGGIPSLRTAIECKFVSTEAELSAAVHGLTEDLSGYAGSQDWVYFYTVVYMTAALGTEGQLSRALGASGNAGKSKMVLVTGAGERARASGPATETKTKARTPPVRWGSAVELPAPGARRAASETGPSSGPLPASDSESDTVQDPHGTAAR